MPIHDDDEQFENYLRRFRPVAPEPPATIPPPQLARPPFVLAAWLAVAAVIVIAVTRIANPPHASVEQHAVSEPLTIHNADAWLAAASSFKIALDDLAFHSPINPIPPGERSAIAVLREEKIKP